MTNLVSKYSDFTLLTQKEIEALLKTFPKGIVALDLETTGLSPLVDKIIEMSAIKITKEEITSFSTLVNPKIEIPEYTIKIHGINDCDVANSPLIGEVLGDFVEFIGELPIIGHNVKFDVGFLAFDISQLGLTFPKSKVYCSCVQSRKCFPKARNHRLHNLTEELNIPIENHHRALDDAIACLNLYAKGLLVPESEKRLAHIVEHSLQFSFCDFEGENTFTIPEQLEGIKDKLEKQHIIWIKYRGGSHKGEFRPLKPVSFLPMPTGNILYALCLLSNTYKSFSLKKITEWKEMNGAEIAKFAKEQNS